MRCFGSPSMHPKRVSQALLFGEPRSWTHHQSRQSQDADAASTTSSIRRFFDTLIKNPLFVWVINLRSGESELDMIAGLKNFLANCKNVALRSKTEMIRSGYTSSQSPERGK